MTRREEIARALHKVHQDYWTNVSGRSRDIWADVFSDDDREGYLLQADAVLALLDAEREECATVCDDKAEWAPLPDEAHMARKCAAAIRARGAK